MVQHNGTSNYGTTYWYYELWYNILVLRTMVHRNGTTSYGRMTINDEGLNNEEICLMIKY